MLLKLLLVFLVLMVVSVNAQMQAIKPGVSHDLAIWRAAHYSDVRYKLNLTLEKMSPVLKGTIEIRMKVAEPPASAGGQEGNDEASSDGTNAGTARARDTKSPTRISFEFKDSNAATQIRISGDTAYDYKYIVMPLRI